MALDPEHLQELVAAQVAIDGGLADYPDTGLSMAQNAFAPHCVRLVVATRGAMLARLSGRAEFIRRAVAVALLGPGGELEEAPTVDEKPPR